MMRMARWWLAVMLAGAVLSAGAAANDLASRQSEAEKQQVQLRDRIEHLQKDIDTREAVRKEAADALKQSELAISRINLRLKELADANRQAGADLSSLEKQITAQQAMLAKRRAELADQLRTQYISGLSPWTALLSGDDPQVLGRNLGYLDYVSQARARAVEALQADIDRLAALQGRADARRAEIEKRVADTAEQKTAQVGQQKARAALLAQLEGQIAAQRAEANKLGRDDQRLSRLIADLDAAIVKQAEAARRRAAQIRRAEEARKKAEAASRQDRGPVAVADPDAADLRPAAPQKAQPVAQEAALTRDTAAQQTPRATPVGGGNGLRHGLAAPVRGQAQGRFGVNRPDGGVWRGVVLRAPEGTPVKTVASGTVVYADWLRGFGNLIIVDHGQQYLTVYAYNQSLLKRVGDAVAAGDTIATVGATGGQVESGLYFEIRHRGAPVDPAQWLAQ